MWLPAAIEIQNLNAPCTQRVGCPLTRIDGGRADPNGGLSKPATGLQRAAIQIAKMGGTACPVCGQSKFLLAPWPGRLGCNRVRVSAQHASGQPPIATLCPTKKMLHMQHSATRGTRCWCPWAPQVNCCFGHLPAWPHGPAGCGGGAPVALAGGQVAQLAFQRAAPFCKFKRLWGQPCKRPTKPWGTWPVGPIGLAPHFATFAGLIVWGQPFVCCPPWPHWCPIATRALGPGHAPWAKG